MGNAKLASTVNSVRTVLQRRSPEILTGIGIAGMISTTVLAVKATPKALMLIEEEKRRRNYEKVKEARDNGWDMCDQINSLPPVDTVKTVWKCYIPAAITGTVSIACLVGASSVNVRRNAALAAAYTISESTLREYKDKVIETVGEKKEKAVRDAIAKDKIERDPVENREIIITDRGNTLCYDAHAGRYFKSDIDKLKKVENEINKKLLDEGYIALNDFYDAIGLEGTDVGRDLGWRVEQGLLELDFSSQLTKDGTPCLVIDYNTLPQYNFDKWL